MVTISYLARAQMTSHTVALTVFSHLLILNWRRPSQLSSATLLWSDKGNVWNLCSLAAQVARVAARRCICDAIGNGVAPMPQDQTNKAWLRPSMTDVRHQWVHTHARLVPGFWYSRAPSGAFTGGGAACRTPRPPRILPAVQAAPKVNSTSAMHPFAREARSSPAFSIYFASEERLFSLLGSFGFMPGNAFTDTLPADDAAATPIGWKLASPSCWRPPSCAARPSRAHQPLDGRRPRQRHRPRSRHLRHLL
jgi:hypothetical protein